MAALDLFPARVAIGYVEVDGRRLPILPSAELIRAFGDVLDRLGGPIGQSITDLAQTDDDDSGLEEFKSEAFKRLDGLDMEPRHPFEPAQGDMSPPDSFAAFVDPMHPLAHPAEVQQLQTEVSELREQVHKLRTQINDILQGTQL